MIACSILRLRVRAQAEVPTERERLDDVLLLKVTFDSNPPRRNVQGRVTDVNAETITVGKARLIQLVSQLGDVLDVSGAGTPR